MRAREREFTPEKASKKEKQDRGVKKEQEAEEEGKRSRCRESNPRETARQSKRETVKEGNHGRKSKIASENVTTPRSRRAKREEREERNGAEKGKGGGGEAANGDGVDGGGGGDFLIRYGEKNALAFSLAPVPGGPDRGKFMA